MNCQNALAPMALIAAGALSLTVSVIVVLSHLWKVFGRSEGQKLFAADDPLLIVFFYGVVGLFLFGLAFW